MKNKIKSARQSMGLTQSEFAAALGASQRTVEKWEQGERKPSPMVLKHIRVLLWFHSRGKLNCYHQI